MNRRLIRKVLPLELLRAAARLAVSVSLLRVCKIKPTCAVSILDVAVGVGYSRLALGYSSFKHLFLLCMC